jgi:hypothetical protein
MTMHLRKKIYKALVWAPEPSVSGKRVTVTAETLYQARLKLEEKYGRDSVFDLHTEFDTSTQKIR